MADPRTRALALLALATNEGATLEERRTTALVACEHIVKHRLITSGDQTVALADIIREWQTPRGAPARGHSTGYGPTARPAREAENTAEPTETTGRVFVPTLRAWRGVAVSGRACAEKEQPFNYLIRFYSNEEKEVVEEFVPAAHVVVFDSGDEARGLGIHMKYALKMELPRRCDGGIRRVV